MSTPQIKSFRGSTSENSSEQLEQSLQVSRGGSVFLSWTTSEADSVELTDSATRQIKELGANVTRYEVKAENELHNFSLVAVKGSVKSDPQVVHVSTHDSGAIYSSHAEVESPNKVVAPQGTGGITALTVSKGDKTSRSFSSENEQPFASMSDRKNHFCFAPSVDELTVAWTPSGELTALTLELYRNGSERPVWVRELKQKKVAAGEIHWKGEFKEEHSKAKDEFPGYVMTAEHAPYLLKAIAPNSEDPGKKERWTYLDVRVQGLKLEWAQAPEKLIPLAEPERTRHVKVYEALTDTTADKNLGGKLPAADQEKKVYLKTNLFYQGDSDLVGRSNSFYTRLHALWGEGAQIPLLVSAQIRDAEGNSVDAPKALGKARFLWDYEDKSATPADAQDNVKEFLTKVVKLENDNGQDSPKGTNAHVKYGGKRGPGASPIFPAQPGIAPVKALPDADEDAPAFPFKVSRCQKRLWAAVSEAWPSGELAGKSGVIFQPSRMAGDAYAIHVTWMPGSEDDAIKVLDERDQAPPETVASTGAFTVWHQTDIAKYVQVGTGARTVDVSWVATRLAKGFVHLNYDEQKAKVDGTQEFAEGMKEIYKADGTLRRRLAGYIQAALPVEIDPSLRKSLIQFKPYAAWRGTWLAINHNSISETHRRSIEMENPKNVAGDEKYDWVARTGEIPFVAPWSVDYSAEVDIPDQHGFVTVEFQNPQGGTLSYDVKFEDDKRVARGKNVELTAADKLAMAKHYVECVRTKEWTFVVVKPDTPPIKVTLKGKTTGAGNRQRLAKIREALDEIVTKCASSDDPGDEFFPQIKAGRLAGLCKNGQVYRKSAAYEWAWNVIELVLQKQFPANDGGLYLLQVGGVDVCNFNGPKAKAMYAPETGKSLVIVLSPTAAAPTLAHEVGHAKFVNHTYTSQEANDPLKLHQQDAAGECTMMATGAGNLTYFCGLCALRMRGWSIFEVTNAAQGTFNQVQKLKHDMV